MSLQPAGATSPLFKLEYPHSVGLFASYEQAQKAVDTLADQNFPVSNLAIVGTDLRLMERVTGRKTWGTVLSDGVMAGLRTGAIVAIIMVLLVPGDFLIQLLAALLIGVGVSLVFAVPAYLMSRGQRDFTSVTQTVATRYEVLCEHKVAAQARDLLRKSLPADAFIAPPRPTPGPYPTGAPAGAPGYGYGPPTAQPGYQGGPLPYPPASQQAPYPPAAPPPAPDGRASGSGSPGPDAGSGRSPNPPDA